MSIFYSRLKELNNQWKAMWLCPITEYKGRESTERSVNHQSSMWSLRRIEYKSMNKTRTKIMECVYIYRYVSFALGVLFLIGLILFMWVALRKIRQHPFQ
jgi:hypothetical protein